MWNGDNEVKKSNDAGSIAFVGCYFMHYEKNEIARNGEWIFELFALVYGVSAFAWIKRGSLWY